MSDRLKDSGSPADEDRPLVEAAQKGDMAAFESLVRKHQKRMLNIAFRITGDEDDAVEVVQDAFISAHRHLRSFRRESKFTTWLTSITVNHSRNRLKRTSALHARVPVSLDAPLPAGDGDLLPDPPSREPSVLDRLAQQDVSAAVRHCIGALDREFREVIVLRDMQELAYEEIGSALQLAIGTVKSRLFRAREAVKECLKRTIGDL